MGTAVGVAAESSASLPVKPPQRESHTGVGNLVHTYIDKEVLFYFEIELVVRCQNLRDTGWPRSLSLVEGSLTVSVREFWRATEVMTQRIRCLLPSPGSVSLIPHTCIVKGTNRLL